MSDRYLGTEVGSTLGWQCQADDICRKVYAGVGALKRIHRLVPPQTLLRMYEALVFPYLDYCSEIWGCMGKSQCDRPQRLQNKAGRINARCAVILQHPGWYTLEQRSCKQLPISVFKYLNNLYPVDLKNMFKPTFRVHSHNVRRSSTIFFYVPRAHSEVPQIAFSCHLVEWPRSALT